jgi:hypothetical protein
MGQHKDQGCPFITLAEECSELAKEALKVARFNVENPWDIRPGTDKSYMQHIMDEMKDVQYQYDRIMSKHCGMTA